MKDPCVVAAKLNTHSGVSVNGMHGIRRFTTCTEEPVQVPTQWEK